MISEAQVRELRSEAVEHGDHKMAVICDIALDIPLDDLTTDKDGRVLRITEAPTLLSDYYTTMRLTRAEWVEVSAMTSGEAWAECEAVISAAEARR